MDNNLEELPENSADEIGVPSDIPEGPKEVFGVENLTVRAIVLAGIGSAVIAASSMYAALRFCAVLWPTVFAAVLSMSVLKLFGKTNLREINMASTGMSAGTVVAAGLAVTIPGLFITGVWDTSTPLLKHVPELLYVTFAGTLLGLLLTYLVRYRFVVRDRLPFPMGQAAARTLEAGERGSVHSIFLYGAMAVSALFTFLRDKLEIIPNALTDGKNTFLGIWLSPMAAGIGYTIGPLYTGVWFAGAVFAYLLLIPVGVGAGLFSSTAVAVSVKNSLGFGLMAGVGAGVLIDFLRTRIDFVRPEGAPKGLGSRLFGMFAVIVAYILTLLAGLDPISSAAVILLTCIACAMSAAVTGQAGINKAEIFAVMALLAVRLFAHPSPAASFFIMAVVAVSCGLAGDMLNDFKAGSMLGTDPAGQLVTEAVGGLTGGLAAVFSMLAVISKYGGVGTQHGLSAGQSFVITEMIGGIDHKALFFTALAVGALLFLFKFPVMTLGLGLYLPFEISSIVFLGGASRFIVDKLVKAPKDEGSQGMLIAAGLMGGEGITGVLLAIVSMVTGG